MKFMLGLSAAALYHGSVPGFHARAPCQGFMQKLCTGASCRGSVLGLNARAPCKSFMQGIRARASCKGSVPGLHVGAPCQGFMQGHLARALKLSRACISGVRPIWHLAGVEACGAETCGGCPWTRRYTYTYSYVHSPQSCTCVQVRSSVPAGGTWIPRRIVR